MDFKGTKYKLQNITDGRVFEDKGWMLSDPLSASPSLIRAIYDNKKFTPRNDLSGLYRFAEWMPVKRVLKGSDAPLTYRSEKLADYLGLNNLYITFSGYWPQKGANMQTCSFKETEAYSVCGRMDKDFEKILIVASAGNTARAFAKVCSENNIPLLLCVPYDNLSALWFDKPLNDCVKLIATPAGSDYFDAINLSNIIAQSDMFIEEGGAKNVARRDGMATTVLSAVEHIGRIPDSYFQAVGSGTGTIAAWEANLRLIEDGRFGNHMMRLCPSQNSPYTLIYDSWQAKSRELVALSEEQSRQNASIIEAKVLSNRKPPYSIAGGLYDALVNTNGKMWLASNNDIAHASRLFMELEGVDIHPAAAVAVSSLIQAAREKTLSKDDIVMLNITGGGEELFKFTNKITYLKPHKVISTNQKHEIIVREAEDLF